MNRPLPPRPRGSSGMTEGEWRYLTDQPMTEAEAKATRGRPDVPSDYWTNHQLTSNYKLGGTEKGTYALRRWFECEAAVLETWAEEYPGCRPSTWWRFSAPEPAREGEATHEYLDRIDGLQPGERERALERAGGRFKKGREVCRTPSHRDWTKRGEPKR